MVAFERLFEIVHVMNKYFIVECPSFNCVCCIDNVVYKADFYKQDCIILSLFFWYIVVYSCHLFLFI